MTTEYNSTLATAAPPERPSSVVSSASAHGASPADTQARLDNRLPEVQPPEPAPKLQHNPNVWSAADLVLTQRTNALYPHPDSQVAKALKANSATLVYSKLNAITSTR